MKTIIEASGVLKKELDLFQHLNSKQKEFMAIACMIGYTEAIKTETERHIKANEKMMEKSRYDKHKNEGRRKND